MLAFIVSLVGFSTTPEQTPTTRTLDSYKNMRYCEVIPVFPSAAGFYGEVWNTIAYNDCPQEDWDQLNASSVADEVGAITTDLNGPRFWLMDNITENSDGEERSPYQFGGVLWTGYVASVELAAADLVVGTEWEPRNVSRETAYTWYAGREVYELHVEGKVYVMQSYSQIVDETLTIDSLPTLSEKLDLPSGWTYTNRTLDEEYVLVADGVATVVTDSLRNTYQLDPDRSSAS